MDERINLEADSSISEIRMRKPTATIQSPDLNKAIQEAKGKNWKGLHVRGKTDAKGRLLALGYYFDEEVVAGQPLPIKWIFPDRCKIVSSSNGLMPPNAKIEYEITIVGKDGLVKQRIPMTKRG